MPPRLPAVSYREPLLAFCTEKEAGCADIFTSPRGLQTLLFAALRCHGGRQRKLSPRRGGWAPRPPIPRTHFSPSLQWASILADGNVIFDLATRW